MKPCQTYHTLYEGHFFQDAWLTEDGFVLYDHPACNRRTPLPEPARTEKGVSYYPPKDVIDACYDATYDLLPFAADGRWGWCDRWDGRVFRPPQYAFCGHFVPTVGGRRLARFSAEGGIDPKAAEALPMDAFSDTAAAEGRWGLMDLGGGEIIPPVYQYLSPIHKGMLLAKQDGLWGVLDIQGNVVLPFQWDELCFDRDFGFLGRQEGAYYILDSAGTPLTDALPRLPQLFDDGCRERWFTRNFPDGPVDDFLFPFGLFPDDPDYERALKWQQQRHLGHCRYYCHEGKYFLLECLPERYGRRGEICDRTPMYDKDVAHYEELLATLRQHRPDAAEQIAEMERALEEAKKNTVLLRDGEYMLEQLSLLDERIARVMWEEEQERYPFRDNRLLTGGPWPRPCRLHGFDHGGIESWGLSLPRHWIYDAFLTEDGYVVSDRGCEGAEAFRRMDGKAYYRLRDAELGGKFSTPAPFEADGKWGYCDAFSGEVLCPPQWGFCDGFEEKEEFTRFNLRPGFDPATDDYDPLSEHGHAGSGCDGQWGLLYKDDFGGGLCVPPIYQYLSAPCPETGVILAKKDGFWGVIDDCDHPLVDFVWDNIWLDWQFGCIAKRDTPHGPKYAVFDHYGQKRMGDLPGFPRLLLSGEDYSYGFPLDARVFECGGQYGVLRVDAVKQRIKMDTPPTLTREEASERAREIGG